MVFVNKHIGYINVLDKKYITWQGGEQKVGWMRIESLIKTINDLNEHKGAALFTSTTRVANSHSWTIQSNLTKCEDGSGLIFGCIIVSNKEMIAVTEYLAKQGITLPLIN